MELKCTVIEGWRRPALLALLLTVMTLVTAGVAFGHFGAVLRTFQPNPVGNGRGVAFDPATAHIFFTNSGDPHIYVVDTSNNPVVTLNPVDPSNGLPINYGALSWDAKRGVLWGGRYLPNAGTPGGVDTIDPTTGVVTARFAFSFPAGDSCYTQAPGLIDGLAYDEGPTSADSNDSLWLSDDNAKTLFHVDLSGSTINSFAVPQGRCNTGITVDGQYLWLALQSGPDTPPHDIVRVAKADPSTVLSSFTFNSTNPGPEDIELDVTTFAPVHCALWSNQFGPTTLKAWALEDGIKPQCPIVATIDIKPGSFPNSINLSNKGVIPVAILGGPSFDVTTIDFSTVVFAGDPTEAHGTFHLEDVNGDSFMDVVLHYATPQTNIQPGDTQACLTGQFNNGLYFQGCDSVRTLNSQAGTSGAAH